MKFYIAGKITGDSDYRMKFTKAELEINKKGHVVLNPAVLPEGMRPEDYMRICFAMLDCADVAYFLDDFEQSEGAKLELRHCEYTGKPILYQGIAVIPT